MTRIVGVRWEVEIIDIVLNKPKHTLLAISNALTKIFFKFLDFLSSTTETPSEHSRTWALNHWEFLVHL